ncbi:CRISPR-associated ring nuclease Csm6 [Methylomarinum sp. Ch1-1]|uniref:CRISPR-associated ring nuclease Csm6 n=1 Tax=Methylomarinum roseum TaxID=3067653 RepID=A0AAU7NQ15_9GAMM|nr:CRISPR-associated ring nuclease Csm6 [Methylomarinum sp. Ch1-1]MDP4521020.1 CRISPR-associated ring nuclease Csm6 [Methylomarinum sp. Ch1-1]
METQTQTILLCVTGLTPQVVTETLYALHQAGAAQPDAIHILTTAEGAERARLTLINDRWLSRFYTDYGLPQALFDDNHIHVLKDPGGQPLQDIRSQQDNQAMADGITELIRQFTSDPHGCLHVSIAGGRKTMGFYAGYALSLYGRDQDRLSHVLVSAHYESHPQFFYPTPYSQTIYTNDRSNKPLDTRQADVMLADIAFVRLRHGLDDDLLNGQSSFSASVKRAQQSLGPQKLIIDLKQRIVIAQGIDIRLKPAELAFYHWLIQNQLQGLEPILCPSDGVAEPDYAHAYLMHYRQIIGEMGPGERTEQVLQEGMSKSFFEQRKARVNRQIKNALQSRAGPYLIAARGKRPRTYYRIELESRQIEYQES